MTELKNMPDAVKLRAASLYLSIPVDDVEAFARAWCIGHDDPDPEERRQAAWHVNWYFGNHNLGTEPGHFISGLLNTWNRADKVNGGKLRLAYPVYSEAFAVYQERGAEALDAWGRGES